MTGGLTLGHVVEVGRSSLLQSGVLERLANLSLLNDGSLCSQLLGAFEDIAAR